ncbi:MAG: VanW family protein [Candidatus Daviesbacteria bacterium]|nr:VanW family protein [Candidatus Daviesbacteria bacterium]
MGKPKKNSHFCFAKFRLIKTNLLPVFLSIILLFLILVAYQVSLADKFFPLTFVGDTNISLLTKGQAIRKVQSVFQKRTNQKLQFSFARGSFTVDLATASASIDYSVLDENFKNSHKNSLIFFTSSKMFPKITLSLDKQLDNIANAVYQKPQNAELVFDEILNPEGSPSARIQIKESGNGMELDKGKILQEVQNFLLNGKYEPQLPIQVVPPKITTGHVIRAKEILEATMKEPIKLVFNSNVWILDTKQLLTLLDLQTGDLLLDKDKASLYLDTIARDIDQQVQEGLFEFNPNTKRVVAFRPSRQGQKLDQEKTYQMITDALSNPTGNEPKTIQLPVDTIKPKIQTQDVNSLGIKELLGEGISRFAGSIQNRIYNINLTASKLNGVLVPPGETFSFNATVGDITAATGFKQAYVIKEGRTVLDDGGGVCQDSTTLFRAVLNAGLPVVKRTAHAYRVGYYEQGFPPGLDATVFYPSVDFQFKNDTPAHVLIQAYTSGLTLYIDLYGTPDGRIVSISTPVVTNQTPPPPELRQDDPTLPRGTVKQVDWSAWGANVSFKRTVVRNGQTLISETWKSSFKPWQAVYLIGTKD